MEMRFETNLKTHFECKVLCVQSFFFRFLLAESMHKTIWIHFHFYDMETNAELSFLFIHKFIAIVEFNDYSLVVHFFVCTCKCARSVLSLFFRVLSFTLDYCVRSAKRALII